MLNPPCRITCESHRLALFPGQLQEEAKGTIDCDHVGAIEARKEADANSSKEIDCQEVAPYHLPADDQTLQRPEVVPLLLPLLPRLPMPHLPSLRTHQAEEPAFRRRRLTGGQYLAAGLLDGLSAGFLAERMYPK